MSMHPYRTSAPPPRLEDFRFNVVVDLFPVCLRCKAPLLGIIWRNDGGQLIYTENVHDTTGRPHMAACGRPISWRSHRVFRDRNEWDITIHAALSSERP